MDSAIIDETSEQFLGQWQRLVSTTNWDKGRILGDWRAALHRNDAQPAEYSDEAWSRIVGNVTPQHVGRLRRVSERFSRVREEYPGLYWSHFQAALDWNDAEMWLEGAVQSGWSIAAMRRQRWEALGGAEELKPRDQDIISSDWDEDVDRDGSVDAAGLRPSVALVHGANGEEEFGHATAFDPDYEPHDDGESAEAHARHAGPAVAEAPMRPFAHLPSLPSDVTEAFDSYKLCILKHKLADWQEISRDDLLASLDALKELALASG